MKHILNVLKNEMYSQNVELESLVKKVTISQESYLKDRSNEALFNIWSENITGLQKIEQNLRYLRTAYSTICMACEVEPQTLEEIIAEKSNRKPRTKKTAKAE